MKLARLEIRRLPGIVLPFPVEFAGGVTVVTGPNGIGKSSLARALRALLWPDTAPGDGYWLRADFTTSDGILTAERDGSRTTWMRSDHSTPPPPLPERYLAPCFTIALDELLTPGQTDDELARRVQTEMAGGYDLAAVATEGGFRLPRGYGKEPLRALGEAQRTLRAVESEQAKLAEDEAGIPQLQLDFRAADAALAESVRLKDALDLVTATEALAESQRALDTFPAVIGRLGGDEAARLEDLRKQRHRHEAELQDCHDQLRTATARCTAARLPAEGIPAHAIDELRQWQRQLADAERADHEAGIALAAASARATAAQHQLTGTPHANPPPVSQEHFTLAEDWLRANEQNAARRVAIAEPLDLLPVEPPVDPAPLRERAAALRGWLLVPESLVRVPLLGWSIALALVAVGLSAALAYWVHPYWSGAGGGVFLLALVALWYGARTARLARERHQTAAAATGLDAPDTWSRAAVTAALSATEQAIAAAEWSQLSARERARLEARAEALAAEHARLDDERHRLVEQLGFLPQVSDASLVALARTVSDLVANTAAQAEAEARRTHIGETLAAARRRIAALLRASGVETPTPDAAAVAAVVDQLQARIHQHAAAIDQIAAATQAAERLVTQLAEDARREVAVFATVDLPVDAEATLLQLLRDRPGFEAARSARDRAAAHVDSARRRLDGWPDLIGQPRTALEAGYQTAQAKSAGRDELHASITRLTERLATARRGRQLSDALTKLVRDRAQADTAREHALFATAGDFLVQRAAAEHERGGRPPVFDEAARLFARITRHAYTLEHRPGSPPAFAATETHTGARRTLRELSNGTRVQLLLAVRLAFAMHSERGEAVPLFLDEALSGSDPQRTGEIIAALRELADEQGRQIIYLTAQPADVSAFRAADGSAPLQVIALDEARAAQAGVADPVVLAARPAPVPAPEGHTAETYAALLQVPPAVGDDPFEGLHLFYALHGDLPTLYQALRAGYRSMGPTLALLDGPAVAAASLGPTIDLAALRAWIELSRLVRDAWRVGRGHPVDAEAVRRSPVGDTVFPDEVIAIAHELRGDARALDAILQTSHAKRPKGFRRTTATAFHQFLLEEGYLDPAPRRTEDDIVQRTVAAGVRLGISAPTELAEHARWLLRQLDGTT